MTQSPHEDQAAVRGRRRSFPWWLLLAAALLVAVCVLDFRRGRTIEATIIGVVALPTLALLVLALVAWKRGLIDDE